MPTDSRRTLNLDDTFPVESFLPPEELQKSYDDKFKEILSKNGRRSDKRLPDEYRKVYIKCGALSEARGSCYIEMGDTKVVCSVDSPREIPNIQEYTEDAVLSCDFTFAPFSCKDRKKYDMEEKFYSDVVRRALEPAVCRHEFPNFQIDIRVMVLDNWGSTLPAAITAASLALANARLPMFDLVTSSSMAIHGDLVLMDPNYVEEDFCLKTPPPGENKNYGVISVAYMATMDQVTQYYQSGSMDVGTIDSTLERGLRECRQLYDVCRQHLFKDVETSIKTCLETGIELPMQNLST